MRKYELKLVRKKDYPKLLIKGPGDCVAAAEQVFKISEEAEECFYVLGLDTSNHVSSCFLVSRGALDISIVTPREIFKRLILANAHSFIAIHNHFGSPRPSKEDIKIAENLIKAGEVLNIRMRDFLIIHEESVTSFLRDGMLGKEENS